MWDWKQQGKPVWQLVDPVDSLHPSQVSQTQKLLPFSVNDLNTASYNVNSFKGSLSAVGIENCLDIWWLEKYSGSL